MVTAYDYPSAMHCEQAGFDVILVGDSLGMVVLGYDTTQPVTMDDMIHHCKAVRRGAKNKFIVGDMPYGSYEISHELALTNAYKLIKETGVDAVKIEGGKHRAEIVRKMVEGGIAVMGHVGLTPQGISVLGGFRAQGRTAIKARTIVDDALALEEAGAFALVIECVPAIVAKAVTEAVNIPVIGIGAGPNTTGQVLVYHDLLGIMNNPHHEKHEVRDGVFPTDQYSPYKMPVDEAITFDELMKLDDEKRKLQSQIIDKKLRDLDEYAAVKLY
eukprot:gene17650-23231_t